MKFLVMSSFKDTYFTLPPDKIKKIMEGTYEVLRQSRNTGTLLDLYYIPGWDRAVGIEEHDSAEKLNQHLSSTPAAPFLKFEVYPLSDFDEAMQGLLRA